MGRGSGGGGRSSGGGGGAAVAEAPAPAPAPAPSLEAAKYSEAGLDKWEAYSDSAEVYAAIKAEKLGTATTEQLKIADNQHIASIIQSEAALNPKNFRGVKDAQGNLQASAIVKVRKNEIYVDYLATAPWNVHGKDSRTMKGAGREMMLSLAREAVSKNKDLTLASLPGAEGFYQKMGFKLEKASDLQNKQLAEYRMDVSTAKQFLASYGG